MCDDIVRVVRLSHTFSNLPECDVQGEIPCRPLPVIETLPRDLADSLLLSSCHGPVWADDEAMLHVEVVMGGEAAAADLARHRQQEHRAAVAQTHFFIISPIIYVDRNANCWCIQFDTIFS